MDEKKEQMLKLLLEKVVLEMLEKDDFKKMFLNELNESVDIPFINEKKEGKLFKSIYNIILKCIKKNLLK